METNYILLNGKKTRKRKQGECFYFQFKNGDTFLGIVLYTGLNWGIWYEKKCVVLFFKNKINPDIMTLNSLHDIVVDYTNLAMPPRIVDNSGWNFGFYKSFAQIDISTLGFIKDITFYNDAFGYVQNIDQEIINVSNLYLCGIQTIANCYGIELLMDISLDYDFIEKPKAIFKPYYYYSKLVLKADTEMQIPYWYEKAKERLRF